MGAAIIHNGPRQGGPDAGDVLQQIRTRRIELDPDGIDAAFHRIVQLFFQQGLVHVVLVLADAERLGIDLHQFRERVHQAAADRYGAADGHVLRRELFPTHV